MRLRPPAEESLPGIHTMLDDWNNEADRLRRAAMLARRGEACDPMTVQSASDLNDELADLLENIELALDRLPAGDRRMAGLLQTLVTAQAIAESVRRSHDVIVAAAGTLAMAAGPTVIVHEAARSP